MIGCDSFRAKFTVGTADAALLAHLRSCDRCLDFAASIDPDSMFRALGGDEIVPPGGIDAFVSGVMQQVRVRSAESTVRAHRAASWPRRLAIAATIAAGLSGTLLVYRPSAPAPGDSLRVAHRAPVARGGSDTSFTTKPIVETYDSQNATIVEVPAEKADSVQIVMIFDENLPADL